MIPSIAFTLLLIIIRIISTHTLVFIFIPWNIFLAVLPLYFSYNAVKATNNKVMYLCIVLWLLFFPNAMYIVTDLFHLRERRLAPLWYDLLILFSAAMNGVTMGFVSLYNIEKWLKLKVQPKYIVTIIFSIFLLCGYGIYLGRYLRWNSWDVVAQPLSLFADIVYDIRHPFRNIEIWSLSLLYGLWLFLLYQYVSKLPLLYKKSLN